MLVLKGGSTLIWYNQWIFPQHDRSDILSGPYPSKSGVFPTIPVFPNNSHNMRATPTVFPLTPIIMDLPNGKYGALW